VPSVICVILSAAVWPCARHGGAGVLAVVAAAPAAGCSRSNSLLPEARFVRVDDLALNGAKAPGLRINDYRDREQSPVVS
jgi:hypothetical protein